MSLFVVVLLLLWSALLVAFQQRCPAVAPSPSLRLFLCCYSSARLLFAQLPSSFSFGTNQSRRHLHTHDASFFFLNFILTILNSHARDSAFSCCYDSPTARAAGSERSFERCAGGARRRCAILLHASLCDAEGDRCPRHLLFLFH